MDVIALGGIGPAAIVVRELVVGLELQSLIVICDGCVVLALLRVGVAAIVEGTRLRVELDGLGVLADGFIVIALGLIVVAAIVVGNGEVRLGILAAGDDLAAAGEASIRIGRGAVLPILVRFSGECI